MAKIIAFEPNPYLFAIAKDNISKNHWTDITLMPFAISSTSGVKKFHIPNNDNSMAGSLLKRMETFGYKFYTIDVQSQQLSKIVKEPVDFLKLDIEGAELEVLPEMIIVANMYVIWWDLRELFEVDASESDEDECLLYLDHNTKINDFASANLEEIRAVAKKIVV